MRTVSAVVVAIVVFVVGTPVLVVVGAFALRATLGAVRYRDLGLPFVVIGASLIGGAALGVLSFRRLRVGD